MKYISENTNGGSIGRSVRCGFSEPIYIPLKEHLLPISMKIKDTSPERTLALLRNILSRLLQINVPRVISQKRKKGPY
jgi:hypothetical protein